MIKRIINFIKWLFNIPTSYFTCDPAQKDGDYFCMVHTKIYPKTGIHKIVETQFTQRKDSLNEP